MVLLVRRHGAPSAFAASSVSILSPGDEELAAHILQMADPHPRRWRSASSGDEECLGGPCFLCPCGPARPMTRSSTWFCSSDGMELPALSQLCLCTREEAVMCGARRGATPSAMALQDLPRSRRCSLTSSMSSRRCWSLSPYLARAPDRRRGRPLLPFSGYHAAVRRELAAPCSATEDMELFKVHKEWRAQEERHQRAGAPPVSACLTTT